MLKRKQRILALTVLGCTAIVGGLAYFGIQRSEKSDQLILEIVQKHRDAFLEDQKILSANPAFEFPGRERDAGPVLNKMALWTKSESDETALFNRHPELLEGLKTVDLGNTGWMKSLHAYDHWDLTKSGPLADAYSKYRNEANWPQMPLPEYRFLRQAAQTRFEQGMRSKDALSALKDVRQLGRLIYSNETLVSSLVYLSLLSDEAKFYDNAVKAGILRAGDWKVLSEIDRVRAKRTMYGYGQMLMMESDPELRMQLVRSGKAKAGFCGGMVEALGMSGWQRALFSSRVPFERDRSQRFSQMDQLVAEAKKQCRMTLTLSFWETQTGYYVDLKGASIGEKIRWNVLVKTPWVREYFVGAEESMVPNYLHLYERGLATAQ